MGLPSVEWKRRFVEATPPGKRHLLCGFGSVLLEGTHLFGYRFLTAE